MLMYCTLYVYGFILVFWSLPLCFELAFPFQLSLYGFLIVIASFCNEKRNNIVYFKLLIKQWYAVKSCFENKDFDQ